MSGSKVWLNFRQLLTGRVLSAVFGLSATAFMARALGPAEFGLVVLLHTYVVAVRSLLNVKPAVTFVKFAVPLMDVGDKAQVNQLLGFIRRLEWVSMLVATAVTVSLAPLLGPYLGWNDDAIVASMAYSLVLLTSPVGTARGFCRALERFDELRSQLAIGPFVRLVGVSFAWWQGLSWEYFAFAWALGLVTSNVFLWWRGSSLMQAHGYQPTYRLLGFSSRRVRTAFPGLLSFQGVVYVQGILDVLPRHLITLLVGALLGTGSAGLFSIARELTDVLAKPVQLIRQAAFTELTRLSQKDLPGLRQAFSQYGISLFAPVCLAVVLATIWREDVVTLVAGEAYLSAGNLMVLLLAAAAIDLVGAILRPLSYSVGKANTALRIQWVTSAIYIGVFVVLSEALGINAVGWAACCAAILSISLLVHSLRAHISPISLQVSTANSEETGK